ncbi:hypothetical protein ACHAQH_002094 [Verticillium albo-atrum]
MDTDPPSTSEEPLEGGSDRAKTTDGITGLGILPIPPPNMADDAGEQQFMLASDSFRKMDLAGAESAAMKAIKMRFGKHKHHPEIYGLLAQIKMVQGQGQMASKYAEKALESWHAARYPDDALCIPFLKNVIASHHLTTLDLAAARPFLDSIAPQRGTNMSDRDVTEHDVHKVLQLCMAHEPSRKVLRGKILDRIHHCKPTFTDRVPYDPVDTEPARSLMDEKLVAGDGPFAMFLAGLGDGRHLFASVIEAARLAAQQKKKDPEAVPKRCHFTICDHHPASIGRFLLMLQIMETARHEVDDQDREVLIASLAYIFSSTLLPTRVAEVVRAAASYVNYALHHWGDPGANPFYDYIQIPVCTRESVASYVTTWWEPCGQAYSRHIINDTILKCDHMSKLQQRDQRRWTSINPPCPIGSQSETDISNQVGIFGPPKCLAEANHHEAADGYDETEAGEQDPRIHDRQLYKMVQQHHQLTRKFTGNITGQVQQQKKILIDLMRDHVALSWKANATMFAIDISVSDEAAPPRQLSSVPAFSGCFGAWMLLSKMTPAPKSKHEDPMNVFNELQNFFRSFVDSFEQLEGFITMDFILGDAIRTMGSLRLGLLEHDMEEDDNFGSQLDPIQIPARFDRIDLSSVA